MGFCRLSISTHRSRLFGGCFGERWASSYGNRLPAAASHIRTHDQREIARFQPDIVGITSVTATFASALKVAQTAKETCPKVLVVLGGPHVTITDDQFLLQHPEVDVVVKGEGEQTIVELARYVSGIKSLNDGCRHSFQEQRTIGAHSQPTVHPKPRRPTIPRIPLFPVN